MEITELLARFKQFQEVVIVLLAAILATNIVALVWVLSRIKDLENRPVHVSSSGFSGTLPPIDGVLTADMVADENMAAQGKAGLLFTYRLASKIPGSQVMLAHKVEGTTEWLEAPMSSTAEDPLAFMASVPLDLNDKISYRLEQRVDGEVVHASTLGTADMAFVVGNGDVYVLLWTLPDSKGADSTVLGFRQKPRSRIEALQVAEIRLKITGTHPGEAVLKHDGSLSEMRYPVIPEGLKNVEVTVVYKDGQTRAAIYDPNKPMSDEPLVKR